MAGVTPERLAEVYPILYHMAEQGTWETIKRFGLLSTSAILDLYEIGGEARRNIESRKRDKAIPLENPNHGRVVIRDQKPIHEGKLEAALMGCSLQDWYELLNGNVFFWLHIDRLRTLLNAKEYRNKVHTVLAVETLPLVRDHIGRITLTPMNTGNTLPIAHPRGRHVFYTLDQFPFDERQKRGTYYQVVELAVESGVQGVERYALRVDEMRGNGAQVETIRTLYVRD